MILKPEILTHPNIPKPLHGLNPRTLKGQEWWDETRQKAYASTDYHCVACGIAKKNAKKHQWLEAHEFFDIDYQTGRCEVISIEPLCHYCHNFIHSGRLKMIMGKDKTEEEVIEILEHGFSILAKNKLKAFYWTWVLARQLGAKTFKVKTYSSKINPLLRWDEYRLILDGKEYRPIHKNRTEWAKFYGN